MDGCKIRIAKNEWLDSIKNALHELIILHARTIAGVQIGLYYKIVGLIIRDS